MFERVLEYTPYAGIGSRETPAEICVLMTKTASKLDELGYTLRSGGAPGADQAFDSGTHAMSNPEIYLPWDGFEGKRMRFKPTEAILNRAESTARKYHPAWQNCTPGARKMHIRNTFQILGRDLETPSKFVLCWTKNGKDAGGTGQALRIAEGYHVPVHNFFFPEVRKKIAEFLNLSLG